MRKSRQSPALSARRLYVALGSLRCPCNHHPIVLFMPPCILQLAPALGAFLLVTHHAQTAEPIHIGSRLELFVDDLLIEAWQGARRELHHPVKAPRAQSPLPVRHMVTVIRDGSLFRAWYRGTDKSMPKQKDGATAEGAEVVHYAESDDGHEWRFPVLGLHEVGGSRENNVILARQPRLLHNFMPFLDTRPGVDPAERFKALSGHPGPGNKTGLDKPGHGLVAWVSPDGIHWTERGEVIPYRPQWHHAFDSSNVAFWSEAEQLYVCYFRTWIGADRRRSISRTTSPDFANWSEPVAMEPNLPGEHLYTNMTAPYERAPHIYLAFPTRFVPGRGWSPDGNPDHLNVTDVLLMSTRAGSAHYDRAFTEAFIRPGPGEAGWLNRANYVAQGMHFVQSKRQLSIYHRSGDRYVLRTDGFISAHAGAEEGGLLTKPLVFSGGRLMLNFSTSAAGGVRVEIQDAKGAPVPGFALEDAETLYGDSIARAFKWKGDPDLSKLAGQPVRLRMVLQEADVFSFQFK